MNDKESIGKAFEAAVGDIAPCYLAEAETDTYPYIVYYQYVEVISSKDGPEALQSNLSATIVSDTFDDAEDIAGAVSAAMMTAESMQPYRVIPMTFDRDCAGNVWEFTMTWVIRQLSIPDTPVTPEETTNTNQHSS
ncbi:MAG: hypothetical protein J5639_09290 [Bacteroidales bacterium]|nr:hypothetical protein [Bacteroidales bacterium]